MVRLPHETAEGKLDGLIFVSLENWDEIWRRNQFVTAGLARRHPGIKILFVGLPRDFSHMLRTGRIAARGGDAPRSAGLPNIDVMCPLKLLPNSWRLGRRINEWMFRMQVRLSVHRAGLVSPILWLNPHSAVHMVGRMGENAVIYDITDDWISLTQSPALKSLTEQQDRELCRKADAVIVCSQKLQQLKQPIAKHLYLIPNGVDADHYRCVLEDSSPAPAETSCWSHPVLGYTGTIHPDRVDLDLIEGIALRMPAATLALVGPVMLPAADLARLSALPNAILTGAVPYQRLPQIMRAFDVCITPHRVTPFTESLNPIKLWEYLAAGKPIVSTPVAGFRDFPELVRLASDPAGFVRAAQEALTEPPDLPEARRAAARRHAWDARLDEVECVIEAVMNSKLTPAGATT